MTSKRGAGAVLALALGLSAMTVVCMADQTITVVNRYTEEIGSGVTKLEGAGGVLLSSLSLSVGDRLVLDPIRTPVHVESVPVFGVGAKISLSPDYSRVRCGRIVLLTWEGEGEATVPKGIFDASSVSGASVVTVEVAPQERKRQLVVTVGDYAHAPEIRVAPIGDEITQGEWIQDLDWLYGSPQYRTSLASRLAAHGYKPSMLGIWKMSSRDAAGVRPPNGWRRHTGVSGDGIISTSNFGGLRDNLHLILDVVGYPDVITLFTGMNDINRTMDAEPVYAAYKRLVFEMSRLRPNALIVGATLLDRGVDGSKDKARRAAILDFNSKLREDYKNKKLPKNFAYVDLFKAVPMDVLGNFSEDKIRPLWRGHAEIAQRFAARIMSLLPPAAFRGTVDKTVTDDRQRVIGAEKNPRIADYRRGFTHLFSIDAPTGVNMFAGRRPYTYTNEKALDQLSQAKLDKVAYYMELVRLGTKRRRFVWVDMDATDKTVEEVEFPWNDEMNVNCVVRKLHVKSNDPSIHEIAPDDDEKTGIVKGTPHDYSPEDSLRNAPPDLSESYGWNDRLSSSGKGYGCFQVHRIFSQKGDDKHWNDAELLFAWNCWGAGHAEETDDIGIGTYYCHRGGGRNSMEYTNTGRGRDGLADTVSADAYQVRHLEIWVKPAQPAK